MLELPSTWLFWALLSAGFAALTAVFAKLGVSTVPADMAMLIRTVVVVVATFVLVQVTGAWRPLSTIPARGWTFLLLSGLATGASWLCYFRALSLGDAARVAPVDKLSVVFVTLFAAAFLGERLSLAGWLGVAMIAGGAILVARG